MTVASPREKPALLFIHGACHQPSHWTALTDPLREQGYEIVAPALATVGPAESVGGKTHLDDVEYIRGSAMAPLLEAGREIVVVTHSYGGVVGTDLVPGLTVEERRERGLAGGVKAMLHIGSYIPPKGQSMSERKREAHEEGVGDDWVMIKNGVLKWTEAALYMLYNGADEAIARECLSATMPHSLAAFFHPMQNPPGESRTQLGFVVCEKDSVMPPMTQHRVAESLGPSAKIFRFGSGHTPWLIPEFQSKLMDIIGDFAEA